MPRRTDQEREIERLKQLNSRLDEQVKLLVRTEQRLHRSQWDRDQEHLRNRALADFALEYSSDELDSRIVTGAVRLLINSFDIDLAFSAFREAGEEPFRLRMHKPDGTIDSSSASAKDLYLDWMETLEQATLYRSGDEGFRRGLAPLLKSMEAIKAGNEILSRDSLAMCMPLRQVSGDLFGFILVLKNPEQRAGFAKPVIGESDVPFIRLLGAHLQRALRNAFLTRDLKDRGSQLSETNMRLKASFQTLKTTQHQLLQSQKMEAIGRLAGGVAHDFNNLLTVIMGHAQLIKLATREIPSLSEDVTSILDASERAANLTGQLLAFGRNQPWRPEIIDLNQLASGLAKMLARLIGEKIELVLEADLEIGTIRADRTQIEQIIMNLVVNARDAMPEGGTLTIATRRGRSDDRVLVSEQFEPAEFVVLSVSDTGSGMDEETRLQIFEPFFTTKPAGEGSGMGLAMVYGLVRQSGGYIGVSSRIGQGSKFTVLFPEEAGVQLEKDGRMEDAFPDQGSGTILLVEDEEFIRKLTSRILEESGYSVLQASNGTEALVIGKRAIRKIDMLLTDVVMPGIGGAELAEELRCVRPDLPVLYMSGYAFEALDLKELGEGEYYLPKPFTSEVLLHAIGKMLKKAG